MPKRAQGLTAAKVRTAGPGRYGDGDGLYLLVKPNGNRSWVFRYRQDGRLRDMGLGRAGSNLADVSLSEARERAATLIKQVRSGIDPLHDRDVADAVAKAAAQKDAIRALSFQTAAGRYIEAHEAGWRNAKHAAQWTATLVAYAYPHFGDVSAAEVGTEHVLAALEPIWRTKPETASRVRGRIEAVLDYARARHWREGENPARWRGHLDHLLPARSKVKRVKHHAALPFGDVGAFCVSLRKQPGTAARSLEFAILTAARTSEVIGATWGEIDRESATWTIPAARMKAGKEHPVPLSARSLAVLDEFVIAASRDDGSVDASMPLFPGSRPGKPLSNMAMLLLLRRMKRDDLTTHGFRSTFRDWCAEQTSFPSEVAEMALAHAVSDEVEAAYRRGDLFKKRQQLMDAWAKFCAAPPKSEKLGGEPTGAISK